MAYALRPKHKVSYSILNALGKTPAKMMDPRKKLICESNANSDDEGSARESEHASHSDKNEHDEDGYKKLVDRPIVGNLLDEQYWTETKKEHEDECAKIGNEKLLAERQVFLIMQRKKWIDDERQIKLLQMQAEKLDREEVVASNKFVEYMTLKSNKTSKVEDWFKCNEKESQIKYKETKKQERKRQTKHDNSSNAWGTGKKDTVKFKTRRSRSKTIKANRDRSECESSQAHNKERDKHVHKEQTIKAIHAPRQRSLESVNAEIGYLNNKDMIEFCSETGVQQIENMGKDRTRKHRRSDETGSERETSSSDETSTTRSSRLRETQSSMRSTQASSFYGRDSSEDSISTRKSASKSSYSSRKSSIKGKHGKRKLKSGMYDRPNEEVIRKLRWAHRYLEYTYRSKNLEFKNMTCNQYIAGETKVMAMADDIDELRGWLRIMNKIGYCMDETGNWQACRAYYAAVIVALEMGEENWDSNFRRFENMLPRKSLMVEKLDKLDSRSKDRIRRRRVPELVFCKDYQRNNCEHQTAHQGKYKDEPGLVKLEHCCAKCWLRSKIKVQHPESSSACPYSMGN